MKKTCFICILCVLFFAVACSTTNSTSYESRTMTPSSVSSYEDKAKTTTSVSPVGVSSLNSKTKTTSDTKVSDVSNDGGKLYVNGCAMPGDGSGLMPGTFTLPNGTKVPLGSTVLEGSYLYTVGSAKIVDAAYNVDYLASSEQARMVCRENLANYLNGEVETMSSRSSTTVNGVNNTSSSTQSHSSADAILQGMEDCGYGLGPDGTSYVLCRVKY